jgi:hypothetical protein
LEIITVTFRKVFFLKMEDSTEILSVIYIKIFSSIMKK